MKLLHLQPDAEQEKEIQPIQPHTPILPTISTPPLFFPLPFSPSSSHSLAPWFSLPVLAARCLCLKHVGSAGDGKGQHLLMNWDWELYWWAEIRGEAEDAVLQRQKPLKWWFHLSLLAGDFVSPPESSHLWGLCTCSRDSPAPGAPRTLPCPAQAECGHSSVLLAPFPHPPLPLSQSVVVASTRARWLLRRNSQKAKILYLGKGENFACERKQNQSTN